MPPTMIHLKLLNTIYEAINNNHLLKLTGKPYNFLTVDLYWMDVILIKKIYEQKYFVIIWYAYNGRCLERTETSVV